MDGADASADDRATRVDIIADAVVTTFGARAPAVVERQIAIAEGEARVSWEDILIRVRILLAAPD